MLRTWSQVLRWQILAPKALITDLCPRLLSAFSFSSFRRRLKSFALSPFVRPWLVLGSRAMAPLDMCRRRRMLATLAAPRTTLLSNGRGMLPAQSTNHSCCRVCGQQQSLGRRAALQRIHALLHGLKAAGSSAANAQRSRAGSIMVLATEPHWQNKQC